MLKLPWKIKLEKTPRPLPQEMQDLVEMVDLLSDQVRELTKQVNRIERKVYRDQDQDQGNYQAGTTAPSDAELPRSFREWITGEPAL